MEKNSFPKGMLLDVGCRDRKQPNFIGIDWKLHPGIDIVHNLEKFPYPIDDEACLTIKAAHIIEHIKPCLVFKWMDEMWRMLLPGGQLAIQAPYAGSPGYYQDPSHCTPITERTWQYFDMEAPLYQHYKPKPWKIQHLVYRQDSNIEVILEKRKVGDEIMALTLKAMQLGAIQKPTELSDFLMFLDGKPLHTVMEIGTSRGGVFYALCHLADTKAIIISIDLPEGEFGGGYTRDDQKRMEGYAKGKQQLYFCRKDSHLESTKQEVIKEVLGKTKLDLLFIDGDHNYDGVKKDWKMYSPLVRDGGLIVFHDICHHPTVPKCQVEKVWKELKSKYKTREFIDPNDKTWGGIGVITFEANQKTK